jgi:plasmid stabilization system protein ParE
MSGFVFHPSALTGLDEIWEFIAADNLATADRVLSEILEVIDSFVSFPPNGPSST